MSATLLGDDLDARRVEPGGDRRRSDAHLLGVTSRSEVLFERVEELEELVADPRAVTAAIHTRWYEHARFLKTIEGGACGGRGHPIGRPCHLGAHDGLLR
jgi:hypothetical protein